MCDCTIVDYLKGYNQPFFQYVFSSLGWPLQGHSIQKIFLKSPYVWFENVYAETLECEFQNMEWMVLRQWNETTADRGKKRERVESNRQTQRNFPILISSGVKAGKPT